MGWLKGAALAAGEGGVEIPPRGSILCGRSPRSDLPIPGRGVSRRHAIFWHRAGLDWVEDAGSTNGTFVNDVRVEGAAPLGDGDVITIGGLRLRYSLSAPASAAPAEPPPAAAPAPPPDAPTKELPALPWRPFTDTPRWRQVTLIGRGGMGEVYRAYDRDLAAPVAIKRLRRRGGDRDRILERLHAREAAIGRTIQHPNVVQVLEDGLHDGDPYILLDWVEGATLGSRIGEEGWSFGDRIELLRQIALALEAAHSVGVVHADLKPSNVLLLPDTRGRDAASNLGILEAPEESEHGDASALGALEEDQALAREIADRIDLPEIPLLETPPFVGRGGEMELLREIAREAAKEDQVRWVLVCGEKGVGKRRLCEEFIAGWREPPQGCEAHLSDEWVPPPEGTKGIWLTMLPPFLPDDPALQLAYERGRRAGVVREIYLKPFLRGQAVRMVERVVRHPPSARAFVDAVGRETGGSPERLRATLLRSFEEGAWARSGGGYRFQSEVFQADEAAAARRLLEGLEGEEKGFRDFMETIAPLGSCLDFQMLLHATELDSAALYYLIDFGVKAGYLRRQANGDLRPAADLLRLTLEKRLDRQRRARVLRRGIPQMTRRLAAGGAPLELYLETAALEREEGRHDRAFRWYVEGALAARALHDRETYLRAVDAARECYREAGARKKPLQHAAEDLLGPAGRGLTGLDRLRRLPLEVRVKITDFGIARRAVGDEEEEDDERSDPLPWGTPRYMSPEQARQKPLSAASDLFSFGILAQELLLGRHPLGGLKGRAAIAAIHAGAIKPPPAGKAGIPEELRVLLGRLLDMSPQKRPAAREIARRLQALQVSMALGEYGG